MEKIDGVYYAGDATVCTEGAFNEYTSHHGGIIVEVGWHTVFIPPNAKPHDIVKNLGEEFDDQGKLITNQFYSPITVEDALLVGKDITKTVVAKYSRAKTSRHQR